MGFSNGRLTYPFVKLGVNGSGDLQQALHRTDLSSFGELISNGSVKLFAKYKGFPSPYLYDDRYSDSGSNRKTALVNANYAISVPVRASLGSPSSGFLNELLNSQLMWSYNRPGVNNSDIFRALDFDGYIDYAVDIMAQLTIASFMLDSNDALTITWPDALLPEGEDGQLYPSDVKVDGTAVTNMYFGLLIYYSNAQYTWAAQNQVGTIKRVTFSNMGLYAGKTVSIVPFLSTIAIGQSLGPSGVVTLASFNLAPVSVAITANVPNWSISGKCVGAFGYFSYDFTATNNTNETRTMEFHIWLSDDPVDASTTVGTNYVYTTKTVVGGGSENLTGHFSAPSGVTYVIAIEGSYNGDVIPKRIFSILNPNNN